jgi:putative membrane protein
MMWSGDGSWGWLWLALPLMLMCIGMLGRMIGHGRGSHRSHGGGASGQRPGGAERILAERLARGEVDVEEYERRLAVLQRTRDVDRAQGGARHVG